MLVMACAYKGGLDSFLRVELGVQGVQFGVYYFLHRRLIETRRV